MYKIYINDTPIFLVNTEFLSNQALNFDQKLVARYNGKPKFLLQYIDMLEKTDRYDAVIVHHNEEKSLYKDFKSLYKRIDAAGGVVYNNQKEVLILFRRGFWDLPKGKIEYGEGRKQAAIREVQEETGLKEVSITQKLKKTLHTYRLKNGKRILKFCYWYRMQTSELDLIPQAEEDIEKAIWLKRSDFLQSGKKTFKSIEDVLNSLTD